MDAVPYVPAPVQTATHLSSLDDLVLQRSQCGIFATADKRTLATDGHAEHPNKDMALAFHREKAVMLISPTWLMRRLGHL